MWHKVRVDTKGGHMIWEEGEGHFFTVLFFCWFFLTYSCFSMFMKDNTICSEEQLYHKAISYFTSIETVATCFDQLIAEMKTFCRNEDFLQSCFFFSFLFFFFIFFLLFLCNMKDIILILEIRKLCYSFQWLQSNRRAIYKHYMYTYIITIYIIYQLLILYFLLTELLSVVDEQWIFSFIFYSTFLYHTFKLWGKTTAFLSPLIFFSVFFFKIALNTTEILKYMLALRGFLWYLGLPVV